MASDDITELFRRLEKHALVSKADMELIEAFVVVMNDRPTTTFDINESGLELIVGKQRQYRTISPTRATLFCIGTGLTNEQRLPSMGNLGLINVTVVGLWIPNLTSLAAITASCQELHECGCK